MKQLFVLLSLAIFHSIICRGQENTRQEVREEFTRNENEIVALREMYAGNWSAALAAFQRVAIRRPDNNEIELKIGNVYMELKQYSLAIQSFDKALKHGNWRKAEIARPKCLAYTRLNNIEGAVSEMRALRNIGPGFFNAAEYANNPDYKNVVSSEIYRKFIAEGK